MNFRQLKRKLLIVSGFIEFCQVVAGIALVVSILIAAHLLLSVIYYKRPQAIKEICGTSEQMLKEMGSTMTFDGPGDYKVCTTNYLHPLMQRCDCKCAE